MRVADVTSNIWQALPGDDGGGGGGRRAAGVSKSVAVKRALEDDDLEPRARRAGWTASGLEEAPKELVAQGLAILGLG
jgi:hypothetical protein